MVGFCEVTVVVVLTSVLGDVDETAELVEVLEELAVRTADRDWAECPLGIAVAFDLPRGVAVPSDESDELDEWFADDCRRFEETF